MNKLMIFDRSNLDEVVCIVPVGHKDNPTDKAIRVTRREDLASHWMPRSDIVLFNGRTKQFALYVTLDGFSGDTWLLELLDDAEYQRVQDIAERMRDNARTYEPARKLVN
jgi:hypothetical protein